MTTAQAHRTGKAGKAKPTVKSPSTTSKTRPSRPNHNDGRWGARLDDAGAGAKGARGADDTAEAAAAGTGSKPVDEYADRGDGRDVKGRYTDGNPGAHMYDESEAKGLEEYLNDLDEQGVSPKEVIESKHKAQMDGETRYRYYDRIVQLDDGTWVGLEVKSGSSPYSGQQRALDDMVSPDNPARVRLDDGRTIDITRIRVWRVEEQ